eukprot:gene2502-2215_t
MDRLITQHSFPYCGRLAGDPERAASPGADADAQIAFVCDEYDAYERAAPNVGEKLMVQQSLAVFARVAGDRRPSSAAHRRSYDAVKRMLSLTYEHEGKFDGYRLAAQAMISRKGEDEERVHIVQGGHFIPMRSEAELVAALDSENGASALYMQPPAAGGGEGEGSAPPLDVFTVDGCPPTMTDTELKTAISTRCFRWGPPRDFARMRLATPTGGGGAPPPFGRATAVAAASPALPVRARRAPRPGPLSPSLEDEGERKALLE